MFRGLRIRIIEPRRREGHEGRRRRRRRRRICRVRQSTARGNSNSLFLTHLTDDIEDYNNRHIGIDINKVMNKVSVVPLHQRFDSGTITVNCQLSTVNCYI